MPLPAAMDARARSEVGRIVAQKSHEGTITGQLRTVYECPAFVGSVVSDRGALCRRPSSSVFSHGLLAGARIRGHGGRSERTTMPADAVGHDVETAAAACHEEGGGLCRTQWVRAKASLE
eukprot:5894775-Pleurochrysis_carterae.AAC.1